MISNWLVTFLATLLVGRLPKAPGTFGSLVALPFWWWLLSCSIVEQIALIGFVFAVGWVATHYYEKWNHRHDPKEVVIDELIGMWITLLGAPPKISVFVLGFLLFRFFDIRKPFPIGWVDRKVPGALGTLLDDVVAGFFAFLVLQVLIYQGSLFAVFDY